MTSSDKSLGSFPGELVLSIFEHLVGDIRDLRALSQTCKGFFLLGLHHVHRHVALGDPAGAMKDALLLIRQIEPYLTNSQRRRLRKRRVKLELELDYYRSPDMLMVSSYAPYVRTLWVGPLSIRLEEIGLTNMYLEAVCNNFGNVIDARIAPMHRSLIESPQLMGNLEALTLGTPQLDYYGDIGLPETQTLKHLVVSGTLWSKKRGFYIILCILKQSANTLKSLSFDSGPLSDFGFLSCAPPLTYPTSPPATIPGSASVSLTSLDLMGWRSHNPMLVDGMLQTVDFTQLTDLKIGDMRGMTAYLHQKLAALFAKPSQSGTDIHLQHLVVTVEYVEENASTVTYQENFDSLVSLLGSFSTLTTLEIRDAVLYPRTGSFNRVGLPYELLSAIMGHFRLLKLDFDYSIDEVHPASLTYRAGHMSPHDIGTILESLPRLQRFQFLSLEAHMEEVARALTRGTELISVGYLFYKEWQFSRRGCPVLWNRVCQRVTSTIANVFLDLPILNGMSNTDSHNSFVWEKTFNLRYIDIPGGVREMRSVFPRERHLEPSHVKTYSSDKERWVSHRERDFGCPGLGSWEQCPDYHPDRGSCPHEYRLYTDFSGGTS